MSKTFLNYFIKPLLALSLKELLFILAFALIFDFFWQYLFRVSVVIFFRCQQSWQTMCFKRQKAMLKKVRKQIAQLEKAVYFASGRQQQKLLRKLAFLRKKEFSLERTVAKAAKPFLPFVSIIIPCHNSEAVLEKTLKAVLSLNYKNKEIIVVDDGSTDKTAAIAGSFQPYITLVKRKVCSGRKTGAINFGLSFCQGDIVVVIDDDTLVEQDALKHLVAPLAEPEVAAVGGNIKVYPENTLLTKVQAIEYLIIMEIAKPYQNNLFGTVLIISGAFGAFLKKHLALIGQWDVDIITEDLDLTWKLYRLRKRVLYNQKAVCYTEIPTNIKQLIKQRSRWDYGLFETFFKHKRMLFTRRFPALGFGLFPETVLFELFFIFARPLYIVFLVLSTRNLLVIFLAIVYFYLALEALTIFTAGLLSKKKRNCLKLYYAPLMLIYHQFLAVLRFRALYRFLTKKGVEW